LSRIRLARLLVLVAMTLGWQDCLVLVVVLGAAAYLVRRCWKTLRRGKAGGCGSGCSACPSGESAGPKVVTLEPISQRRDS